MKMQTYPRTGVYANVPTAISARYFRGTNLKHISSTGFSRMKLKCTPQLLADQGLILWDSTDNTSYNSYKITRRGIIYLTE